MSERTEVHEPTAPAAQYTGVAPRDRTLLWAALTPPIVWALHLLVIYGVYYAAERVDSKGPLFLVSAISLCFTVTSAIAGWTRRSSRAEASREQRERARFMALFAFTLGVFFTVVIIAETIPVVMLKLRD
jgi:heme/copper-type cytochrome/quinol oxidase subunit 3